jgi:topoisomerase-4 subunit A
MDAIKNHRSFVGDNDKSQLLLLTDVAYPRIKVTYGGNDAYREPEEIDCEQFIGVKGYKAKGKRISTFTIDKIEELEPIRFPEEDENSDGTDGEGADGTSNEPENLDPDAGLSQQQVADKLTGQLNFLDDLMD